MYIEPCCAPRQLPQAIRQGSVSFFQTSGDVTLRKMLDACASMAGSDHTMLLCVAEADLPLLRTLADYMRRGWTRALLLLTQTAQTELVQGELNGYLPRVHYAADPMILDGLCALFGSEKALILQGAILSRPDFSLCQYAAYLGSNADTIRSAIDPLLAKLKTKAVIDSRASCPEVDRLLRRQIFNNADV